MQDAIIVADDSTIVQNIIIKSIKRDLTILRANNGMKAIEYIMDRKYKIKGLFLDLNMPDYDGFVVLNYLKDNNLLKKIPVFIISGDDSKETIERAFKYNIVDLLTKPFNVNKISEIVERIMG